MWLRCIQVAARAQVPPPTLGRDLATLLEAGEAADVIFKVFDLAHTLHECNRLWECTLSCARCGVGNTHLCPVYDSAACLVLEHGQHAPQPNN